jgi:hypothetical protein
MAVVKSAKQTKNSKPSKARDHSSKNGAGKARRAKPVRIEGGSGRIPSELLEEPGPSCPGAVELFLRDRNR